MVYRQGPMMARIMALLILLTLLPGTPGLIAAPAPSPTAGARSAARKVTFDSAGIIHIGGKPFFPVALFTYSLDDSVMAEIHQLQFNTDIMLTPAHQPEQLDTVWQNGLMAICPPDENWIRAGKNHPAVLAWYLQDEPEGHGVTPEAERTRYLALKAEDPNHPIGLCHYLWESLTSYKDACDFTMTDVYPITAHRDTPITNVGKFLDEARRIHGAGWPAWSYIQVFGGPDTEGGKWAQPLPDEVRCMTYIALVHRATGILYFPYWPKAPRTWNSIGPLNGEIHRMAPWLVANGKELAVSSSAPQVMARARSVGKGGILMEVNTTPLFVDARITAAGSGSREMNGLFTPRRVKTVHGALTEHLGPYETRVYTWGPEPDVEMARPGIEPLP